MSSRIFLDGYSYLSSREAGRISGYTHDYVARLCRLGEIVGRKIGQTWYVNETDFEKFIAKVEVEKNKRSEQLSQERKEAYLRLSVSSSETDEIQTEQQEVQQVSSYLPFLKLAGIFLFMACVGIGAVQVVTSAFGVEDTATIALGEVESITVAKNSLTANVFETMRDFVVTGAQVVFSAVKTGVRKVANLFWPNPVPEKTVELVQETQTPVTTSVTVSPDSGDAAQAPVLPEQQGVESSDQGLVVVPSSDNEIVNARTIARIRQTFSDQVEVTMKDDTSGIITPVFREVSDEDYLFVLVPLQKE